MRQALGETKTIVQMETHVADLSPKKSLLSRVRQSYQNYKFMYLLLLPGLVYFLIFEFYPLWFLQFAFKDFNVFTYRAEGITGLDWVGWDNFERLFSTRYFMQSFRNTLIISFMKYAFQIPAAILLALLLNELRRRSLKRVVQTIAYLPHFLSWVIIAGLFITILSPSGGVVNQFLGLFGVEPVFFMIRRDLFRWVLLAAAMWKNVGWMTIIYLAALAGVDPNLYEAAIIDGANRFQRVRYITLPAIIPTIVVVYILGLRNALEIFEQVFAMYNPVVAEVSETISTYVYQVGIQQGDVAFATTVGLFKSLITMALVLTANHLSKKVGENY
jgi:putative aldouronate transport system permease protein